MKSIKHGFRQIKRFPAFFYWPPAIMLILYSLLFKKRIKDPNNYIYREDAVVGVAWHNRLLFFPLMFPAKVRKRTVAVVSASRDGQYISDLIKVFGIKSVRGSSSRKGASAQREAVKFIKNGCHVCFTPDGPRGPKYSMSRGPVHLASKTGACIIPICINSSSYWQFKSWDNFQIPKPFSTITIEIGDQIVVPAELDEDTLSHIQEEARVKLLQITRDIPEKKNETQSA